MRIVLADDSLLLREGLQLLLTEAGHTVVGAVGDGPAFTAAMLELRPDLGIVDVRMPPNHADDGLSAAVAVRRQWSNAPILVLSQYVEVSYADELFGSGSGGFGYLLKDRVGDIDDFLGGVERVAAGGTALDPLVVSQLLMRRRAEDPITALTARERQVLALMAEGRTNASIAAALVITDGAVEKHTQRIFAKLDLTPDSGHRRVRAVLAYLRS